MKYHSYIPQITLLTVVYSINAWSATSNMLPRTTTESLGMADANVAMATGPSAQYINPAALDAPDTQEAWEVSGYLARNRVTYTRYEPRSASVAGTNTATNYPFVPAAAWAKKLAPNLTIGLSIEAPFGSNIEWPDHTFDLTLPAFNADTAHKAKLEVLRFGPALSYRISDRLNLGIRLAEQYVRAVEANDLTTVKGDGFSQIYQLGLRFQDENYIFGSSYTSRGHTKIKGDQSDIHPAYSSILLAGSAHANIDLPARWQTGLALRITSKIWWESDIDWVGWSSIQDLTIVQSNGKTVNAGKNARYYHNTTSFYTGVRWARDETTWYFGTGYDPTPVDQRDASPIINQLRKTRYAIGGQTEAGRGLRYGIAYQYVVGHSRNVNATLQDNTVTGDSHLYEGNYKSVTHIIGASLSGSF